MLQRCPIFWVLASEGFGFQISCSATKSSFDEICRVSCSTYLEENFELRSVRSSQAGLSLSAYSTFPNGPKILVRARSLFPPSFVTQTLWEVSPNASSLITKIAYPDPLHLLHASRLLCSNLRCNTTGHCSEHLPALFLHILSKYRSAVQRNVSQITYCMWPNNEIIESPLNAAATRQTRRKYVLYRVMQQ